MAPESDFLQHCPMPIQQSSHIQMAHGSGGRAMQHLIEQMFLSAFGSKPEWRHDSARLDLPHGQIAFTTDSYVVSPLFFPGGDIGSMAVYGTVNDLAMSGAKPVYLSLSFILEEGLALETLWSIVQSIQIAAERSDVQIVTGDTKVVERGKADGLYINTAGVGIIDHSLMIAPHSVKPGDAIIVSGDLGRHAIAILLQREGLEFESSIMSDLAPVTSQIQALLHKEIEIHCLRDLTRGGLASAMNEIAQSSQLSIQLFSNIPINSSVQAACEVLGLDPLCLANEGRFVLFTPEESSTKVIDIINAVTQERYPDQRATQIGVVEKLKTQNMLVSQYTIAGGNRIIRPSTLEQMPRIC